MNDRANPVQVIVSADKMTAEIYIPLLDDAVELDAAAVRGALEKAGVAQGVIDDDRICEYIAAARISDVQFAAALGKQPGIGRDASVTYEFARREKDEKKKSDTVDHREKGAKVYSAAKGETIAWRTPPTRGDDGWNVLGETINGEWGMDTKVLAGENVAVNDDGTEFTALTDGMIVLIDNSLRIDPVFTVGGNVDFSTGNINFPGALHIKGDVNDGFIVKSGGSILVEGSVAAAVIMCGGDMEVKGGIITQDKGHVKVKGALIAKFIENSNVEADGNVTVSRAIINSRVSSAASVLAVSAQGTIIGGEILARNEIAARTIGASSEAKTVLRVGHFYEGFNAIREADEELVKVNEKLEDAKKSLVSLAKMKAPPEKISEQKNRALELDTQRRTLLTRKNELKKKFPLNQRAAVRGEEVINEGCQVYVGNSFYRVSRSLRFATLFEDGNGNVAVSAFDDKIGGVRVQTVVQAPSKQKTLIVDDARFMRVKLREILQADGYRVIGEAENGEQAVEMARSLKPELITMDITMPTMDGISATREIRKTDRDVVIVMISALGQTEKVRESIVAGASNFVVKPFDREKVLATVRQSFQSRGG